MRVVSKKSLNIREHVNESYLGILHVIEMARVLKEQVVLRVTFSIKPHGETNIKGCGIFNHVHILLRKLQGKSLDVALEMFELPAPENWEDVWRFMQEISQCYASHRNTLDTANLLKHFAYLLMVRSIHDGNVAAGILGFLNLSALVISFEIAAAKGTPRSKCHSLRLAHGDDISLKITGRTGPVTLVNAKLA